MNDGWQATRQLKSQLETRHMPVIIVSSPTDRSRMERARAAGRDVLHPKPADIPVLLEEIKTLPESRAKPHSGGSS